MADSNRENDPWASRSGDNEGTKERYDRESKDDQGKPALAYIAGAVGLLLTLGLIGFVAREALIQSSERPPSIIVTAEHTRAARGGFEVAFEARNVSARTASNVQIQATLLRADTEPLESNVTLDYVPGHSTRKGGIFLPADPAAGKLQIRALGYAEP